MGSLKHQFKMALLGGSPNIVFQLYQAMTFEARAKFRIGRRALIYTAKSPPFTFCEFPPLNLTGNRFHKRGAEWGRHFLYLGVDRLVLIVSSKTLAMNNLSNWFSPSAIRTVECKKLARSIMSAVPHRGIASGTARQNNGNGGSDLS